MINLLYHTTAHLSLVARKSSGLEEDDIFVVRQVCNKMIHDVMIYFIYHGISLISKKKKLKTCRVTSNNYSVVESSSHIMIMNA